MKAKLPPYGRSAMQTPSPIYQSIIFTGSGAWDHISNKNFYPTSNKLLLPFGDDSNQYQWPENSTEVMVFSRGEPETKQQLLLLSKCLLQYGANFILWVLPDYPITKIEREGVQ